MFNPGVRYVLNASLLGELEPHVEDACLLSGSEKFRPLRFPAKVGGSKILVERYRGRGIGDLMFVTGPLNWIQAQCGHSAKIYTYAMASRRPVLAGHPALAADPGMGPVVYGSLDDFKFHWFIDNVTEFTSGDQRNVYDEMYEKIGVDPASVDERFKRPSVQISQQDLKNFAHFSNGVGQARGIDLNRGFSMVAPLCQSQIRSANYSMWVEVIRQMAETGPVIVVGNLDGILPDTDMSISDFSRELDGLEGSNQNVVNAIGPMPLRTMMTAAAKARVVVCLDSGPLYAAQAARVPAVSLWGPVSPGSRIKYDQAYMDLAVHISEACQNSPCHAWRNFPSSLCPDGSLQRTCATLSAITPDIVMEKVEQALSKGVLA